MTTVTWRSRLAALRPPGQPAVLAAVLTFIFCSLIVLLARWGPDWPAQEFRAWIAAHDGLSVWTSRWYGGSALPGYSVLYPLVGGAIGAGPTGLLAAVATAWVSMGLAPSDQTRARVFGVTGAILIAQIVLIGQIPFLLGTLFGLMGIRALLSGRHPALVAALAALCSLGSPLAGAFLLVALPALAVATSWRRAAPVLFAVAGSVVSFFTGGADGPFPCQWLSMVGMVAFSVGVVVLAPRDNRALQVFGASYAVAALAVFFIPDPIGGNLGRLGKLLAVPLACHFITIDRRAWVKIRAAAIVLAALAWPSIPFATAAIRGATDPSQQVSFYSGLNRFLSTQNPANGRLEIPFTREHWESLWVARRFPIARGWERQSDLLYNRVLYKHTLDAAQYKKWLYSNAVSLVALPKAPIDYGGEAEAALLKHPPGYLRPIWHDANWTVWRVIGAPPLVTGPVSLVKLDTSSIRLGFTRPGAAVVRVRASSLWVVGSGAACVEQLPDGWLRVIASRAGMVEIAAQLNGQLVTGAEQCPAQPAQSPSPRRPH